MSVRLPCKVNNLFIIVMDRARATRSIWFYNQNINCNIAFVLYKHMCIHYTIPTQSICR